ncbi:vitamin B12-dependent ribonucleotide reductase [Frankia sp. AgB1.9]|uniref:vitamin B12-dependent ribonucleotide reductase n=1 Tax=unclassified Frankia TaxID=2632575 RepID=UPI00193486C5|nr:MULTISPECIES: vitamin B12-dependent ribonucleotide reductase [unclassified Frankia]MBL7490056.1 vitamin B12-dependent ribonucleotide reductase [Frankia sp. AgW1.1]MBL7551905.1 vitamin B12-dependent ribonucleotide reductase [Frankia sp. AgB1.9]MBL7624046.1 vitamin B12-dependent ribonucleotide reductase [Frankia sp. AgB1.8]
MTETRGAKQKAGSNGKAASTAGKPAAAAEAAAGEAGTAGATSAGGGAGGGKPAAEAGKAAGSGKAATPKAAARKPGLRIERRNTTAGVHPYDQVTWESRDVVMTNWRDGSINFEQRGVEFPANWSINASNIVTSKYFRGAVGSPQRESSLRQLIDRVVHAYGRSGRANGYFASDDDAEIFEHELTYMLLHQMFSFNSPVWFNVGTPAPQQVSACFILAVDDTMESILNWYREEGLIFKGGSGSGLNLSRIRSSKELLSSGGTASGPVSFMRGADASAGTIKSGGATRRAAKMVVLDVDHPDVVEFVETKAREEDKIRALRDAGFDMDLGGKDITSVQYQNANNSVRVTDDFMRAVQDGTSFDLRARMDHRVIESVDARELMRKISTAAWECADPGIQYDGVINDWHTTPEAGRISASNPCSEYMHLDNSSCNLASLNLMRFLRSDLTFDVEGFVHAVELIITAMDISICFADFPTPQITEVTRAYRQLGIGYANLGALLMASARAYDSEGGRTLAAAITSLMTGTAYRRSAELAGVVGPYDGYARDADGHRRVIRKHAAANDDVRSAHSEDARILAAASKEWAKCLAVGERDGWRNAQASLLAPTGTIGLAMDCDTTGIEPDLALVKMKKLVGGASMKIVNQTVPAALRALGYTEETLEAIVEYIAEHGHVIDAPGLRPEHYEVFDCAIGERAIAPIGHVRMMAAVQPFLSGAISKTVNMPETATVEEVEEIYVEGWKLGLKALAIYRDNCKVGQPLTDVRGAKRSVDEAKAIADAVAGTSAAPAPVVHRPVRKRLPKTRPSQTVSFSVGGAEGYMTAGSYPDNGLGEIFVKMSKQGSTLAGVMDAFSIAISIALQYGVPLETYVSKFINMRFEPAGMTDDPDIRIAQSLMDYLFRRLALDYLSEEQRAELGILTAAERARQISGQYGGPADADLADPAQTEIAPTAPPAATRSGEHTGHGPAFVELELRGAAPGQSLFAQTAVDAPLCFTCGVTMRPAGSCYVCEQCGSTSGCS